MKTERVVLDTNVLISALLSPFGSPFACVDWVLDNATLIVSRELLEELETRLARPEFGKYVDVSKRRSFVAEVGLSAVQVLHHSLALSCFFLVGTETDTDRQLPVVPLARQGTMRLCYEVPRGQSCA